MLIVLEILVLITSFMAFEKKFSKDISSFCLLIIYFFTVFVIGCRFANNDYFSYFRFYNSINSEWEIGVFKTRYLETFFVILAIFEKKIYGSFVVFLTIFAAISIALKYWAFKKMSPYLFLSVLLYSSNLMFKDYIQIRNAMSSGIVLYSLIFITESNCLKYYLCNYFAIINHSMAWTACPLYLLKRLDSRKILLFVLFFSFFISISFGNIANSLGLYLYELGFREEKFIGRVVSGSVWGGDAKWFSVTMFLFTFLSLLFIKHFHDFDKISKYGKTLVIAFIYGFCSFLIFHDFRILAGRYIDMYCTSVLCILLPICLKYYKGIYKLMFLFFIYVFVIYNLTVNNGDYILSYESVLFHIQAF